MMTELVAIRALRVSIISRTSGSASPSASAVGLVVQTVVDIDPGDLSNMSVCVASELTHAAPQSVCSKALAFSNMLDMSRTFDTSHLDRSASKNLVSWNMACMNQTFDTSQLDRSWLKTDA